MINLELNNIYFSGFYPYELDDDVELTGFNKSTIIRIYNILCNPIAKVCRMQAYICEDVEIC